MTKVANGLTVSVASSFSPSAPLKMTATCERASRIASPEPIPVHRANLIHQLFTLNAEDAPTGPASDFQALVSSVPLITAGRSLTSTNVRQSAGAHTARSARADRFQMSQPSINPAL